jgi:hypothetical protein
VRLGQERGPAGGFCRGMARFAKQLPLWFTRFWFWFWFCSL